MVRAEPKGTLPVTTKHQSHTDHDAPAVRHLEAAESELVNVELQAADQAEDFGRYRLIQCLSAVVDYAKRVLVGQEHFYRNEKSALLLAAAIRTDAAVLSLAAGDDQRAQTMVADYRHALDLVAELVRNVPEDMVLSAGEGRSERIAALRSAIAELTRLADRWEQL